MIGLGTGTTGAITLTAQGGTFVQPPPPPVTLTTIAADGWQAVWPAPPATVAGQSVVVTRQGFDAAGSPATPSDPVAITARVRQPGSATPTADRVALSRYIYDGDTVAGVSNTSTLEYPLAQFAWLVPDRQEVKGDSVYLRIAVAHRHAQNGKPVAAVRFIVRDHLGAEADLMVTDCVPHTYSASGLTASVYEGTVDIAALSTLGAPSSNGETDGKTFTIDAEFRPWIGVAHRISVMTAGKKAEQNTVLIFGNNRDGWRKTVYAYVSPTGNNATGVVSETATAAQAAPFANTAQAARAVRNWHDTNTGRGAIDGAVLRLTEGTHVHTKWPNRACDHYVLTLEGAPGTDPANVIYTDSGASAASGLAQKILIRNITLRKSSPAAVYMLDSGSTDGAISYIALQNVALDDGGNGTAGGMIWRWGASYFENCTANANLAAGSKVLGCVGNFNQATTTALVASRSPNGSIRPNSADRADGLFVGWSHISNRRSDHLLSLGVGQSTTRLGLAIIGSIFESYGPGGTGPVATINGDGNEESSRNILFVGNTMIGGRINMSYTDSGGSTRHDHLSVLRFNLLTEENHKAGDFFGYSGESSNPARVGNWSIRYGVDAQSNTIMGGESRPNGGDSYYPMSWLGDVRPPGCIAGTIEDRLAVAFTEDQSGTTGTGGGDYTPLSATNLATIPSGLAPWPYDLQGRAIANDGTALAGAAQSA